jgi:hypothetical protein
MAGTILTSSPHYFFFAVEDYHACLMKNWQALATLLFPLGVTAESDGQGKQN